MSEILLITVGLAVVGIFLTAALYYAADLLCNKSIESENLFFKSLFFALFGIAAFCMMTSAAVTLTYAVKGVSKVVMGL